MGNTVSKNIKFSVSSNFSLNISDIFKDSSSISLFLSNLMVIFLAIAFNWNLAELLWIYLVQSLIIGFFQFIKILDVNKFSLEGINFFDFDFQSNIKIKVVLAIFFVFHYGFFHLVYLSFIKSSYFIDNFEAVITASIIFFINHFYSFIINRANDKKSEKNLSQMMGLPYIRIFPIHFVVLTGAFFSGFINNYIYQKFLIFVFLLIKTLADSTMHKYEHEQQNKSSSFSSIANSQSITQ